MNRMYSDDNVVLSNALIGFAAYNQNVMLFDFGNVIVRRDYKEVDKVRILSGGGSGNEPAYAGFVGRGMLTAAIHGAPFQSPTSRDILRAIRELNVNHTGGILVITQGNKGASLNFGLAVERAVKEKIRVMMIVVCDDYNNKNYPLHKKRGLTGIVLIFKIAGALAEAGYSLTEIFAACTAAEKDLCSVSVGMKRLAHSADICSCKKKIEIDEVEIGVGINEEPGVKKLKLSAPTDISHIIVKEYLSFYNQPQQQEGSPPMPVVILVNNVNGFSMMEVQLFIKDIVSALQSNGVTIMRLIFGRFLSSPTLVGLVVSVFTIQDDRIIQLLDAPTDAAAWPSVMQKTPLTLDNITPGRLERKVDKYVPPVKGPKFGGRQVRLLTAGVQFACDALISCERQLNVIDTEQGDGDTGTRLKNASELIQERIQQNKITFECPFGLFDSLSKLFESSVGGTLGCIYGILFEAAANYFGECKENEPVTCYMWLNTLEAACKALQRYGSVELEDNTMYDPLEMCHRTIKEVLQVKEDPMYAFEAGVQMAQETSQKTKSGHSKYPDSGAHAVGILLRAVYEGVKVVAPNM